MTSSVCFTQLTNTQLGVAIVLLLVASVPVKNILVDAFSPLRSVPGPPWARITKLWRLRKSYEGNFEQTLVKLHAKYGCTLCL